MQFHDLNVLRSDACGFVNLRSCGSRHVVADDLHHVAVLESAWCIGGQGLCLDHYVSRQPVLAGELFAADDSGSGATGGWAALVTSERAEDVR